MWQLDLLSWVIPAFAALGQDFIESDSNDLNLVRDAQDYYSDMVHLGQAVATSCGEWTSGLREVEVDRLLKALESRLPTRRVPFGLTRLYDGTLNTPTEQYKEQNGRRAFKKLHSLAKLIEYRGLGHYHACGELLNYTDRDRKEYLDIIRQGSKVNLFHGAEKKSKSERQKFLEPVKLAAKHMLNVYFKDSSTRDEPELSLSQHPSSGMKEASNRIYALLESHWQCKCEHSAAGPGGRREARLSLVRHHVLALKLSSARTHTRRRLPNAKYEILLPVCEKQAVWKVTNVEVNNDTWSDQDTTKRDPVPVYKDICQWLKRSQGFPVDFGVKNNGLWHFAPSWADIADHHTAMASLKQLLGDGVAIHYSPKEKLILCYILANSMLFLYPGSWLHTTWDSNNLYFICRTRMDTLRPVELVFPYLSAHVQEVDDVTKIGKDHMQCHPHPSILDLGIVFLEIATGSVFERCNDIKEHAWERCNEDFLNARKYMEGIEQGKSYVSEALREAIWACIDLKSPRASHMPSNSLAEEGPIRQYLLSCVILPLALELRDGYKVSLEDLNSSLERELRNPAKNGGLHACTSSSVLSRADLFGLATTPESKFVLQMLLKIRGPNLWFAVDAKAVPANETSRISRDLCLMADTCEAETEVDRAKAKRTEEWFELHDDVLARIQQLTRSATSENPRVKIAILDSGLELSADHRQCYDYEPKIQYWTGIDDDANERDDVGHGTHLAILLRKIAPRAAVHVARVFEKKPKSNESAEMIAKALRHAVDVWKIDIVVMSFGFAKSDETLYQAIQHAAREGVLIFAAASNAGKNLPEGIAWPAREENVICVHSADGFGNRSAFTPSPKDNMRIMVLGEYIKSPWPEKLKSPENLKHMSGTSCAAPIAAGIAAVILDYARDFLNDDEWKSLRRVRSMRRMFEELRDTDNTEGYWWIKHWTLFTKDKEPVWIQEEIRSYFR